MTDDPTLPLAPLDKAFATIRQQVPRTVRDGARVHVAHVTDIVDGQGLIVSPREGLTVGLFRVDGTYYAVKNVCPHNGAPLCRGSIHATHEPGETRELNPGFAGRILRCPWHGWEFDIVTGKALYDATSRVATYPVDVDDKGQVFVTV
ncbi:MAG TPA: Rieske (2Fe-2S) protein [Capsulimonadaceae bacterium]|jgi:nitrite reductase/ring-hydroxylating ferredoxin subunit